MGGFYVFIIVIVILGTCVTLYCFHFNYTVTRNTLLTKFSWSQWRRFTRLVIFVLFFFHNFVVYMYCINFYNSFVKQSKRTINSLACSMQISIDALRILYYICFRPLLKFIFSCYLFLLILCYSFLWLLVDLAVHTLIHTCAYIMHCECHRHLQVTIFSFICFSCCLKYIYTHICYNILIY